MPKAPPPKEGPETFDGDMFLEWVDARSAELLIPKKAVGPPVLAPPSRKTPKGFSWLLRVYYEAPEDKASVVQLYLVKKSGETSTGVLYAAMFRFLADEVIAALPLPVVIEQTAWRIDPFKGIPLTPPGCDSSYRP